MAYGEKYLLRQPDILVKQVADELGFPEQFSFRKYFKSHTGQSPTEYQQVQKTDGININK